VSRGDATHIVVQLFTITQHRGYVFACISDSAYEGDLDRLEADCRSWVESVRFLDE
jgi:hypothetical protein